MKSSDIFLTPKTQITLIRVDHKTGEETEIDLGSNVITNLGRSNMAHLLAGDDVADRRVSVVKFGDGGHNPESPTTALIPTTSDTASIDGGSITLFGSTITTSLVRCSLQEGATSEFNDSGISSGSGNFPTQCTSGDILDEYTIRFRGSLIVTASGTFGVHGRTYVASSGSLDILPGSFIEVIPYP